MIITEDMRYINIPASRTAEKSKIRFFEDGKLIFDIDVQVDEENPTCIIPYDIRNFIGRDVEIKADKMNNLTFLENYSKKSDPLRPKIHFSADYGWLNDPNGLVFYEGKYHLFFQSNPAGLLWSNMHWGHAVSEDLINWTQEECALFPDDLGDMFSGSAIIDKDNLLGVKSNEHDTIVLFYTAAGNQSEINKNKQFSQCIAYSTDGAKTFVKYNKNPIIPTIEQGSRDPKVIFDKTSKMYVMALYIGNFKYALFKSDDLIKWDIISSFVLGNERECPDFYPLCDGDTKKWVFTGANDYYYIGDFDINKGFFNISEQKKFGFGNAYAAQSWSGVEDRRLRISWNRFRNIDATYFTCSMSVPCEVYLKDDLLRIKPAKEAENAFFKTFEGSNVSWAKFEGYTTSIKLELTETSVIELFETKFKADFEKGEISCTTLSGEQTMPLYIKDGISVLGFITDNIGTEVFSYDLAFGAFETINFGKEKKIKISGNGARHIETYEA